MPELPMMLDDTTCQHGNLLCIICAHEATNAASITWMVGQRCRIRGRLGIIRALSQTTPCVTSVDVQLDRDEQGHMGWICTSVDELEPA